MTFSPGPASFIRGPKSALPSNTRGGGRVPEWGPLGSVRGALSNERPYRDPPTRPLWRDAPAPRTPQWDIFDWPGQEERACDVGSTVDTSMAVPEPGVFRASGSGAPAWRH